VREEIDFLIQSMQDTSRFTVECFCSSKVFIGNKKNIIEKFVSRKFFPNQTPDGGGNQCLLGTYALFNVV
jgi:hypothetical protein